MKILSIAYRLKRTSIEERISLIEKLLAEHDFDILICSEFYLSKFESEDKITSYKTLEYNNIKEIFLKISQMFPKKIIIPGTCLVQDESYSKNCVINKLGIYYNNTYNEYNKALYGGVEDYSNINKNDFCTIKFEDTYRPITPLFKDFINDKILIRLHICADYEDAKMGEDAFIPELPSGIQKIKFIPAYNLRDENPIIVNDFNFALKIDGFNLNSNYILNKFNIEYDRINILSENENILINLDNIKSIEKKQERVRKTPEELNEIFKEIKVNSQLRKKRFKTVKFGFFSILKKKYTDLHNDDIELLHAKFKENNLFDDYIPVQDYEKKYWKYKKKYLQLKKDFEKNNF